MASNKQIEANRLNAKKSTGPVTPTGKAASSMNALKSGLHAKSLILPGEKAEDLQTLIAEYYTLYQPDNPDLRDLVDDMIACVWQIRRLHVTEVDMYKFLKEGLWNGDTEKHPQGRIAANSGDKFHSLHRCLDSARRARDRARDAFKRLRAEAPPVEPNQPAAPAPSLPAAPPPSLPAAPPPARPAKSAGCPAAPPATLAPSPASPAIGFVPSTSPGAPDAPANPAGEADQAA
ncbi:MAG: hypothetical protein ABI759_16010 [Candidatus Solibacter sp.]